MRLRQRVDALALDRVLGGQHQERVRHRVPAAAQRDLPLGHHLQQRRLHLGRRPVDLVGQHEVGEDRPEFGVELLGARPVDPGPDDVGGHQVRGELQPGEAAADGVRQGLHRQRLGNAGDALEQAVAASQQADHHPLDHPLLADDHPLDLEHRPFERARVRGRGGNGTGLGHESPIGRFTDAFRYWVQPYRASRRDARTGPTQSWLCPAGVLSRLRSGSRVQPPIADIGRSGCRKPGAVMPWPAGLARTASRISSAISASVGRPATHRAGRSPGGRTGSCAAGRRRSAGAGRRPGRTAGSPRR